MRQVTIEIEEDDWREEDLYWEIMEVAGKIKEGYTYGITGFGNNWSIDKIE